MGSGWRMWNGDQKWRECWWTDGGVMGAKATKLVTHWAALFWYCVVPIHINKTHSKCQRAMTFWIPLLKAKSQLDLSEGCNIWLLILGCLSDEQIYLFERWGQKKNIAEAGGPQRDKEQSDTASLPLVNEQCIEIYELYKAIDRLNQISKKGLGDCGIHCSQRCTTQAWILILNVEGK